jgi:hypothetical protein
MVRLRGSLVVQLIGGQRTPLSRSLVTENRLRVTIQGRDNKSLDASGTSGLVIDNLPVTQLSPAASTQTLGSLL